MPPDRSDKVPELIEAALRARDPYTALLLLGKAKQIAPQNLEIYRLRAEILEREGDYDSAIEELHGGLGIDATAWDLRFRLLELEYPKARNLAHAAGIVGDLVWERGLRAGTFNAPRGSIRSESELAYDLALLRAIDAADKRRSASLATTVAEGRLVPEAVDAAPGGDSVTLLGGGPWLVRSDAEGRVVFGVDLWIAAEERGIERPTDVAAGAAGEVFVGDAIAHCVRAFDRDGKYTGPLASDLRALPIALACAGEELVVLGEDARLRRYDPRGKALGRPVAVPLPEGEGTLGAGLAVAPDGRAIVVHAGRKSFAVVPRRGKARVVPVGTRRGSSGEGKAATEAKPAKPLAPGTAKKRRRAGVAIDPTDGAIVLAADARGAIQRLCPETGKSLGAGVKEAGPLGRLRAVRDVAVTDTGHLLIADGMDARVVRGPADGAATGAWTVAWEAPGGGA